ncbi:UDP-Glycosyltransferase superfamily protein [Rhynchospora pubera]|uniref:2,4-dihydroxy-7-methoxy-2H-1,4-benzoxazin-3(4H)-one 2-D-glucosyltransferase n=1 Tax=Rhynchospora pubera TaxID=906938 RepID=A0AAV8C5I5_9POAL|nr:UDP-Glycosyltransferase superfamily protein [Rhynchospora pubera]
MGKRVLLFPLPYQGHINPMLEVAAILHSRGFSITIFHTNYNSIDSTKYPSYRFILVDDQEISSQFRPAIEDTMHRLIAWNNSCEQLFLDSLTSVISEKSEEPVACLIRDTHWYNLQYLANRLGVPTLVLRIGSAATLNWFLAFPRLFKKGFIPVKESQLDMPVVELEPLRMRDLPAVGNCSHQMMHDLFTHDMEAIRASSGVIINTFDAIDSKEVEKFKKEISVAVFCIGPLHKFTPPASSSLLDQDHSCLEWLETQAPSSVLYVSFGSLACRNYDDFIETAWGLANSEQPFIWVVRPGSILGKDEVDLPEGFNEATRGHSKVVSWAPQQEVLAHAAVGAFWTHNGWNSTLEAICEGVPMICRPQFADQMGNARYVTHVWKVGIGLEGKLERGKIENSIKRLMKGEEGAEINQRMRNLKNEASCCIKSDGSSSISIDMLINFVYL